MSMFLPEALTATQQILGLTVGFSFMAIGVGAALWHIFEGEKLTWRSSILGPRAKIPFSDLRNLALEHGIALERYGAKQNNGYDLEGALKQAARSGKLSVEGRPYNGSVKDNDPLIPIPSTHFDKYSFRHGALDYEIENDLTRTATVQMDVQALDGIEGVTFYDLYVSRRQAIKVIKKFAKSDDQCVAELSQHSVVGIYFKVEPAKDLEPLDPCGHPKDSGQCDDCMPF